MRALTIGLALVVAGCASSDPCAGRSGTCIALTVTGSVSGIDALAVTVDQPASETRTTPAMALSLPVTIGLNLPTSVAGVVNIEVAALSGGTTVAEGSAQANVVGKRGTATVTLAAGGGGGDMAGSGGDGFAPGVPGAPTDVVASSGNAQATVTWSPPASSGGSAITSYTIVSSPGAIVVTTSDGSARSASVNGLTNDTSYTFAVSANNAAGAGPATTSNPVTPTATPTVPSAPTNVMAVADVDHGAHLTWTGADNHGSPLVGYTITSSQVSGVITTAGPTATSAVIGSGLTPGMTYSFSVAATNGVGMGQTSFPSNNITAATLPGAPTGVAATVNADGSITVNWSAPASNGFSAITKYTVSANPGTITGTTTGATTLMLSGFAATMPYTFTVVATNLVGDSVASSASGAVKVPMHDTLCMQTGVGVDFYDHYMQVPNGATTPSRSTTLTAGNNAGLTIDAQNGILLVGRASTGSTVDAYLHAPTLNGTIAAPDFSLTVSFPVGIALDLANHKLYVGDYTNAGTTASPQMVHRFPYDPANPSALATATSEADLRTVSGYISQLWINPANGDLWVSTAATGASGVNPTVSVLNSAYSLPTNSSPNHTYTIGATSFYGAVYSPAAGGTLYVGNASSIQWVTGVDATNGNVAASGMLSNPAYNLAIGNGMLFGGSAEVDEWNLSSLSGSPAKHVSGTGGGTGQTIIYVP